MVSVAFPPIFCPRTPNYNHKSDAGRRASIGHGRRHHGDRQFTIMAERDGRNAANHVQRTYSIQYIGIVWRSYGIPFLVADLLCLSENPEISSAHIIKQTAYGAESLFGRRINYSVNEIASVDVIHHNHYYRNSGGMLCCAWC